MTSLGRIAILLMLGTVLEACSARASSKPVRSDTRAGGFARTVTKIALMGTTFETISTDYAAAMNAFDRKIADRLRAAGYEVIDPDAYRAAFARKTLELGGYFDPATGSIDREKYDRIETAAQNDIVTSHGADAFFRSRVTLESARWDNFGARWCNVAQKVQPDLNSFMDMAAGVAERGDVPATCLRVRLDDKRGATLYGGEGGIELLATSGDGEGLEPIGAIFQDEERNAVAVELALRGVSSIAGAAAENVASGAASSR
jgi:hypothetical protein